MSYPTTVPGKIEDLKCLKKAAKTLGATLDENARSYRGWGLSRPACEGAITHPQCRFDIGLIRKGKHFEMNTDLHGGEAEKIYGSGLSGLKRAYGEERVRACLKNARVVKRAVAENGDLLLTVRR